MKRNGYVIVVVAALLVVSATAVGSAATLGQEQPSGEFGVSALSAPANVSQGEQLEVDATVTNNGSDRAQATVEYRFDGETQRTRRVNLDAGEDETVEFRLNTRRVEVGNYTHGVFTDADNVTAEIEVEEGDGPGQGPPEGIARFQDTRPLTAQQTEPNSLAGLIRVESQYIDNTSAELARETSTEYSLNLTITGDARNVTFYLQSTAVEESLDLDNVTAYLDGEQLDFYVNESAGPGNSPWILFEVDHFSTRTVTFTTDDSDVGGDDPPTVVGSSPAQDTDGDDLYEDVTGDGVFTISDVNALLENRNSDVVQQNANLFDFDDDGAVTLADVQALFSRLVGN